VYLLELSNGLVKVGYSDNIQRRLIRVALLWNRRGVQVGRFEVFPGRQFKNSCRFDPQKRERKAIKALRAVSPSIKGSFEYFDAIPYDTALVVVSKALET
jgi:hypothetical protein